MSPYRESTGIVAAERVPAWIRAARSVFGLISSLSFGSRFMLNDDTAYVLRDYRWYRQFVGGHWDLLWDSSHSAGTWYYCGRETGCWRHFDAATRSLIRCEDW